jgi:Polysaccharide pyruvyl transferase
MGTIARRGRCALITLFCVRPRGFNIGNDTIFLGLRHLLREAFDGLVNIVQVPAVGNGEPEELTGLQARTVHDMNLYGHGVVVGGGNVYENGQLAVDPNALRALHPPLMLFSLSRGRIYDNRHELVPRTDAMPDPIVRALHERAALSLARDEATLDYLRALGLESPVLGGCPSLLVRQLAIPQLDVVPPSNGCLLSVRHPRLMSIPLRHQARLHSTIVDLMAALEADGFGPVRILCHDTRDVAFASSLGDIEYILADDVHAQMALLRHAPLVVSFRLHAFLPCVSFGTPAINISYDERSRSLVRTIGMESWDIDLIRSRDVVAEVRDRCARLGDLAALRESVQPLWQQLEATMRAQTAAFARLVTAYAAAT